jgi:hypothetical protein
MFFGYVSINRIIEVTHERIYATEYKNGLVYFYTYGSRPEPSYGATPTYLAHFFNTIYEENLKENLTGEGFQDMVRFQAPAIPIWYRQKKNTQYEILKKWDGALNFRPSPRIGTITWLFFLLWSSGILYNIYLIVLYYKLKK